MTRLDPGPLPASGAGVRPGRPVMPHEGDAHARTWMAWPGAAYALSGALAPADEVRRAWAAVANAISEFEPVSMLIDPGQWDTARRRLSGAVSRHPAPLDDAWMRDTGPTFVRAPGRAGLAAVSWRFNAWGGLVLAGHERDDEVAAVVAGLADAPVIRSRMVNEGGGIHVDGAGTVLVTETVQLDPRRNPGWTRADVEAELGRTVGAERVIWLPRGLARDYGPYGTRGHVDMVATFARPGHVLVHSQHDPRHPDAALSRHLLRRLRAEHDASGRALTVTEVPAPRRLRTGDDWSDENYVNHALVNGGVIACRFDDPADEEAAEILRSAYPGREVVTVDARAIFALGGGVHCITQQQPRAL